MNTREEEPLQTKPNKAAPCYREIRKEKRIFRQCPAVCVKSGNAAVKACLFDNHAGYRTSLQNDLRFTVQR
jgi:hypothetical protein